jgi:hypothetical protein
VLDVSSETSEEEVICIVKSGLGRQAIAAGAAEVSLIGWSCMAPTLAHRRQELSKQVNRRRRDYNKQKAG